jgi:hypothetical protein
MGYRPGGRISAFVVTQALEKDPLMVGNVTPATIKPPPPLPPDPDLVKKANDTLDLLLQDKDLLKSLADQSTKYVPPSEGRILATLWGLFNTSGSFALTKDDIQHALFNITGGGTTEADALWSQMNPDKAATIGAGDFAQCDFLIKGLSKRMDTLVAAIEKTRQDEAGKSATSGTLLDYIAPHGRSGTILDFFA